jgi:transcriptional regulator with XRE-family HTH domain
MSRGQTTNALDQSIYSAIGSRIRSARTALGMSQDSLAEKVGLTRTSITNLENGRQQVPLHTLYALADSLGKTVHELIPDSGPAATTAGIEAADVDRWTTLLRTESAKPA